MCRLSVTQLKKPVRSWRRGLLIPRSGRASFSASDTAGEKLYEEFSDPAESVDLERFINVGVVTQPLFHGRESIDSAIATLQHLREQGDWARSN